MSCEPYRRLLRERDAVYNAINPASGANAANCPETADALNDFLRTGTPRRVRTASASAIFTFPRGMRWRNATLSRIAGRLRNCSHVVVRGMRRNPPPDMTPEHYFILFKVDDHVYAADAFTGELEGNPQAYVDLEPIDRRMVDFAYATGASYDVTVSDPLATPSDPLSDL